MKHLYILAVLAFCLVKATAGMAAENSSTLIRNVQIFNGSDIIASSGSVRIEGNRFVEVSAQQLEPRAGETIIDGKGRFLMPGLIDAHVHVSWSFPYAKTEQANNTYATAYAVANAQAMLARGFTTVRDTGGTDYGLPRAIDDGVVPGPRIFFTGRTLSQTGGHGDHRNINAPTAEGLLNGFGFSIADGKPEVIKAAREELRRGAQFVKIHAGGGVSSPTDPLHSIQYSQEEMNAAVQTAADRGTYVAAHAYTPESINRALNAGVKTIEHGNLIDKKTARLAAKKGAFVVPNLVTYWAFSQSNEVPSYIKEKNNTVYEAMAGALKILKDADVKIGFGTDLIMDMHSLQNQEFALRSQAFSALEILRQATSINGELLELSGPNNPYGKLGVVAPGAVADLLLIDGDPTQDILIMTRPETLFSLVMKDGIVVRESN